MSPRLLFHTLAIAEAISWTLLIGGMILRATADMDMAVTIGGGIHGFVFLAYAVTAILVSKNQRLGAWPTTVAVVSAVIPYATIPADMWLTRTGRLHGTWRRRASEDPRDAAWHDRLFRTVVGHPLISALVLLAGVVVAYLVLLAVGNPREILTG